MIPDGPSGQSVDSPGIGAGKSSSASSAGGIFDGGLDVYRTVTEDDYRSLLTSGLIVLDASALLNLYRYHADTREVLIEVLTRLKDLLWVPHQAMLEFFDNRLSVIASRSGEVDQVINTLQKNRVQLETGIRAWVNRVRLPEDGAEGLIGSIRSVVDDVVVKIREQRSDSTFEHAEDTAKDPVIVSLATILDRSIGSPLSEGKLREAKKEARQRIIDKRPPGWRDANKRDNPEGDYIIWYQTLQEAKHRGVDVLLVTGDVKDDWWRTERGETKGPLAELAYEMRIVADVRLFMLRPESLLVHAGKLLGISVSSESVQDAERVTAREAEWNFLRTDPQVHEGVERIVRAMQQLDRWNRGTDTYAILREPVTTLEAAAGREDLQGLLDAVWKAVETGSSKGWFGGMGLVLGPMQPSNWEAEVWAALDFVYINAVQVWLEHAANLYIQLHPDNPKALFDPGQLPPGVINVDVQLVQLRLLGDSAGPSVQFTAFIRDSRRVVVQRFIPPGS